MDTMTPPFRRAPLGAAFGTPRAAPQPDVLESDEATGASRLRFADMDPHLHCSVIGTCLSTAELRRLMRRFIDVDGQSDLTVHHEAVRLVAHDAEVARTLGRALDRQHEPTVRRFARAKAAAELDDLWTQAQKAGEIPGAYWAALTHRRATPELRQRVFGDVHMLSHLVGAANRADVRRLVALEQENAALRERTDRQQERLGEVVAAREQAVAECDDLRRRVAALEHDVAAAKRAAQTQATTGNTGMSSTLEAERRCAAEARAQSLEVKAEQLALELAHLREHVVALGRELAAAESELRRDDAGTAAVPSALASALAGRRLLYVGGRPSSHNAIRSLVLRHGGEYQRHDGGIEDRKGMLAAALAWADLVVFPVDCVDHDSAQQLKRTCMRLGTPFLPLRSASVASFAAGVIERLAEGPQGAGCAAGCLRHG